MRERSGQSTVEWVGLLALVSLLVVGLLLAGIRLPDTGLASAIARQLVCAVGLSSDCAAEPDLVDAYGPELAATVLEHAPEILYEEGMTALPVDFRSCRDAACGNAAASGAVWTSDTGEPATAFVHVLDCRAAARAASEADGLDCSGERAGGRYVQYWLYYEDSTTLRRLLGDAGHHEDDWESLQIRLGPGGAESRASSHRGYNYRGGIASWPSDAGFARRSAWGPATGRLHVSGGSHAGRVRAPDLPFRLPSRLSRGSSEARWTPASRLRLVPIESLTASERATPFAVTPPWRKRVYQDPESEGT